MEVEGLTWEDVSLEIERVERDAIVAGAKFARFALEQEAMNAELERDPEFSHETMGSVLKAFREFAEAKEELEQRLMTAKACRAAYTGDATALTEWLEQRQRTATLPEALAESAMTPLNCAVMGNQTACVSMLMNVCDVDKADRHGVKPIDRAKDAELRAVLSAALEATESEGAP